MTGRQEKPSRIRLPIKMAGACLCLVMAALAAAGQPAAHAGGRARAQAGGRPGGTRALAGGMDRIFRPTAKAERLTVPASLKGGRTAARPYAGYVLVGVRAEGSIGQPAHPLDPVYWVWEDGRFGGYAEAGTLDIGFVGSTIRERGAESITRWIVYAPGEGWKDPLASPLPRLSPDHRYRFVLYLGTPARRVTLGTSTRGSVDWASIAVGDGRWVISLTPVALSPGVRVPAMSRSWVPITPDLLSLRGRRVLAAETRDVGPRRWRTVPAPRARIVGAGATRDYAITFLGTDMLPVRRREWPTPWGTASRDRLVLPSGVRVRLTTAGNTPALAITGRREPLTFGNLLTDPSLWTPKEINDMTYQLKGYYSRDAYDFFGLARFGAQAVIGVVWYSPAASHQPRAMGFVLRLGRQGQITVIRRTQAEGVGNYRAFSPGPPLMDVLPDGRMVLVQHSRMWVLRPGGDWREVRATVPQYQPVWLRGPWLMVMSERSYRASVGYPVDIQRTDVVVQVQDVLTRRPVRGIRWSILERRPNSLFDTPAK